MSDGIPFSRVPLSPSVYLGDAWTRVKDQYGLFLGITAVGLLLGSLAPLGILMGPMMCGIYLCYRQQAKGLPVTFDLLFKGFDHFAQAFIASLLMMVATLVVVFPLMVLGILLAVLTGVLGSMGDSHMIEEGAPFLGCFLFAGFFLVLMVASLLISVFFTFTYPLILDRGLPAMDAVKLSFQAARANLGGLLLLALANALLGFLGLLCCYIGVLLALPIIYGTHWLCYERVFGIYEG